MQARFYLPMYGRFASPDPARDQHFEETQSWNIYSYCQNNPVMMLDPTGEAGVLSYLKQLAVDTGKAAVHMAVHNPVSQAVLQLSDVATATNNAITGRDDRMVSNMGKAVEDGGGYSGAAAEGLKGINETMAVAVAGNLVGRAVGAVEGALAGRAAAKAEGAAASAGEQVVTRTTRSGDPAIRVTKPDGSVTDISAKRVKEYVPNTHPKAPPGTLDKVKVNNPLPGSKGYKRAPTAEELERLNKK